MYQERIRLLKQERMNLGHEMRSMLESASKEGRTINAEERSRWDAMDGDVKAKGDELERLVRMEELDSETRNFVPTELRGRHDGDEVARRRDESNGAVRNWLKGERLSTDEMGVLGGRLGASDFGYGLTFKMPETRAAQSTSGQVGAATGTAGGDIIAPTFYHELTEALKYYHGMRQVGATTLTTDTGATLQMPTVNDTGNLGTLMAGDGGAGVTNTALVFGQSVLNAYIFSSDSVLVPLTLMQDSAFPLDSFVGRQLGIRIARQQNLMFTTGTGGGTQPTGVLTGATLGFTGATGKSGIAQYSDYVNLEHALDPDYRREGGRQAKWMMSDAALADAKLLVDGNGRPLWQPFATSGLRDPFTDMILGYPVVLNQSVPVPGLGAKSIVFGDFSEFYIRDVRDVTVLRLNERYADLLQVGFIAFARADSLLLDAGTHPVIYFQGAAS